MRAPIPTLGLLLVVAAHPLSGQGADILPAHRRLATVEQAVRFATVVPVAELPTPHVNPFAPGASTGTAPIGETVARTASVGPRALLEAIAPLVNPTGVMMLNGEPLLLFGQKRIKVGDTLPITFDGAPHLLVISRIQNNSFTLRLNGEETTRSIKPANRP